MICGGDRGKEDRLIPGFPSLRTVRADLPHTALRLMVLPQRGLTGFRTGLYQIEKPVIGKVGIRPTTIVHSAACAAATFASFPNNRSQPLADEGIKARKHPGTTVFEVLKPAAQGAVHIGNRAFQTPSRFGRCLATNRVLELSS